MLTRDAKYGWARADEAWRVAGWDCPGEYPIIAFHKKTGDAYKFDREGRCSDGRLPYLRDAPAPKASGTDWIVRWKEHPEQFSVRRFSSWSEAKAFVNAMALREVAIIEVPWTEGQGLQPEGGR